MTKKLDLEWDMGLAVCGCLLMLSAIFCTLCFLEEVRRMHALQRFERVTEVPYVVIVLAGLVCTVGSWVAEVVLILSINMEDAEIKFHAGITAASILAPLPCALLALVFIAEAARDVAVAKADTSMTIESIAESNYHYVTFSGAVTAIRSGWRNINYGYLSAASLFFTGWAVLMHFVIVEGLEVEQATGSYQAGTAVGGVVLCLCCMFLGCWLHCLLPELSGSKECTALIMTAGVIGLYFTAMVGLEWNVDELLFDPISTQTQWRRHYLFGVAIIGMYGLVSISAACLGACLSRRALQNNHFLGVGIGVATGIALDFMFTARWLQLPLIVFIGLIIVGGLCFSGIGEWTALGFSVGCGYAYGPFLEVGYTGFGVGCAGAAVMLTASMSAQYAVVRFVEYRDVEAQKARARVHHFS